MKDPKCHTVAKAVRLEENSKTDETFIVFKIIDTKFKQKVREDWNGDIELVLDGKILNVKE